MQKFLTEMPWLTNGVSINRYFNRYSESHRRGKQCTILGKDIRPSARPIVGSRSKQLGFSDLWWENSIQQPIRLQITGTQGLTKWLPMNLSLIEKNIIDGGSKSVFCVFCYSLLIVLMMRRWMTQILAIMTEYQLRYDQFLLTSQMRHRFRQTGVADVGILKSRLQYKIDITLDQNCKSNQ